MAAAKRSTKYPLVWISGRQEGSWAQFRGAVEALELDRAGDDTEDGSLPLHRIFPWLVAGEIQNKQLNLQPLEVKIRA